MMDTVRRSANFAENQIKFLLKDLNSPNNAVRVKGIKRYQEYIQTYRPCQMGDECIDQLFLGDPEENIIGLLGWSGSLSTKHGGQLKRICSNVISLIKFLICLGAEENDDDFFNVFFDRFVRLPPESLRQINFVKHIAAENTSSLMSGSSRCGNAEDACEILALLLQCHVNAQGDPDPISIEYMCEGDAACQARFMDWLHHTAKEEVANMALRPNERTVSRPKEWSSVRLTCVPLQPDEEGFGSEEETDGADVVQTVPDPLGLSGVDLKATQAMHLSGISSNQERGPAKDNLGRAQRRATGIMKPGQRLGIIKMMQQSMKSVSKSRGRTTSSKSAMGSSPDIMEDDEENDDSSADGDEGLNRKRHTDTMGTTMETVGSVLPSDKNFLPELFLSLVHGNATIDELRSGLENLKVRLNQQSSRREDLVRQHYGLFVHCVDGLEWLKEFHTQSANGVKVTGKQSNSKLGGILHNKKLPPVPGEEDSGVVPENRMRQAIEFLEKAKQEAQNTLSPILTRMHRSRQLKNADQILKRLVSTLEYPYAMQQLLAQGEYESVLNVYRRVQSLPATSGLRILKRVSQRADQTIFDMKQKVIDILYSPSPVLPVLQRLVKLLRELEDEEGCRAILQQSFEKQMATFEEQIKQTGVKFSENLMKAFMRGQELNLMHRDPSLGDGEKRAGGRSVSIHCTQESRHTAASIRNAATRRRRHSVVNDGLLDAVRGLSMYDSGESNGYESDNSQDFSHKYTDSRRDRLGLDIDDLEYRHSEGDVSDTLSVDSSEASHSTRRHREKDRDGGEEWGADPDIDYSEFLCSKVRVTTARSLVDLIDMWLPSVHRLLQILTSAPSGAGQAPVISTNTTPTTQGRKNLGGTGVNRSMNTTYARNQSVAGSAKQLGDVLNICSDIVRGNILGFKTKSYSPFLAEIISKPIFSQGMLQNPLKEPFLTTVVMEISEVYDVIETVLMGREGPRSEVTSDDFESINFFGSIAYRDAIATLRALAEDGEVTIAKESMEQLITSCLYLTSTANTGAGLAPLQSERDDLEVNTGPVTEVKQRGVDEIIRVFENAALRKLHRLVDVIRRPDWVAFSVWECIQRLLDRFISSLAIMATATKTSSGAVSSAAGNVEETAESGESSSLFSEEVLKARLELENLEMSLMDTQHVQVTKNQNLEFIKACVHLRTQTVSKLWVETKTLFPLENVVAAPSRSSIDSSTGAIARSASRIVDDSSVVDPTTMMTRRKSRIGAGVFSYDDDDAVGVTPTKRKSRTNSISLSTPASPAKRPEKLKEKGIDDRIALSVGSISVMEENAVVKYLDAMLLYFRTNIHATYSIIVKSEMTSTWEQIQFLSADSVPSHVSKVLLELESIQCELFCTLSGMTVAASLGKKQSGGGSKLFADADMRDWVTDSTKYEEFLFHIICISVLDVYADLVESLALNTFSLHSTGRKPVSRRLSSVSRQHSDDSSAAMNESKESMPTDYSSYSCKYLLSCRQALEEFEFLEIAVRPLVLSHKEIPVIGCRDHIKKQFKIRKGDGAMTSRKAHLWQEARLFVEAVRNKSSGRYAHPQKYFHN